MNWLDLLASDGLAEKSEPLYARITAKLTNYIKSGQLPDKSRLPTNRELAVLLGIDRSTVSRAYLELSQAGLIESHVGRGTFVRASGALIPETTSKRNANAVATTLNWSDKFSEASKACSDLIARQPSQPAEGLDVISFAGGIPTEEFFPQEQFQKIVGEILASDGATELFGYSPAEGNHLLRAEVKKHLQTQGITCSDSELLIVSGSQQGIDLVTDVFVNPNDGVALEDPSYFWAICNFKARQARCFPVTLDEEGLRLDVLESHFVRENVKLLYVMPSFQNPTGATMSLPRRQDLLRLCLRYQVPILEDNFVGDLNYGDSSLPPLRALPGGEEIVIHQGTFSKALCPGLRLGWLVAPSEVTNRLLLAKRTSDLSTNSIAQVVLANYLSARLYASHLSNVKDCYRSRRDAMLQALESSMQNLSTDPKLQLTWHAPQGGLFVWAKLPDGLSARELLLHAEQLGVSFSPGDMFFLNGGKAEYLRLCFIQTDESVIKNGIKRLSEAVRSYFQALAQKKAAAGAERARVRNNVLI